jgi:hypothetical protein
MPKNTTTAGASGGRQIRPHSSAARLSLGEPVATPAGAISKNWSVSRV